MSVSIKKLWNDYGIAGLIVAAIALYLIYMLMTYVSDKSSMSFERMDKNVNPAYSAPAAPQVVPSNPEGQNEEFASANGVTSSGQGLPSACNQPAIQNPSELLPRDVNSQWAELNPSGKGELANINLLKAGYHIGIDTIGQSLRNANLQIRSEPPNPQLNVGPWLQSTITPDYMRPPLEIGSGPQ